VSEPFYFGPEAERLFGVYHEPTSMADRDEGVVIAAPYGRELMKTHRALRQLAIRLARAGFHVLRFDYRGCGDSAGEAESCDLADWVEDLESAADELKDRTGVGRVAFVGLRLGGTLALLAGARRRDVEALVLWEPILDGPAYATEMRDLGRRYRRANRIETGSGPEDVMGFPLGEPLRQSLEGLKLVLRRRPARRVLFLAEGDPALETEQLSEALKKLGATPESRPTAEARVWLGSEGVARALIPQEALKSVVGWLAGVGA
jgi:alpha-beta hydrolase superfamily lysophospholipase